MSKLNTLCDVLVVGAGVSGLSAAIASARSNVRTILIEKNNFLGGVGYSGMFQYICGLYLNSDTCPSETLNEGIAREISIYLNKLSPSRAVTRTGMVNVLPYKREELRSVFESLCKQEENLTVLYNASAVSVDKGDGNITGVSIDCSGKIKKINPNVLIDCSGSGKVSAMAGAAFKLSPPEKIQMAGYLIRFKGLKDPDETLSIKVPYYLAEAVDNKTLPGYLRFTTFSLGDESDEGYCKLSIGEADCNERDQKAEKASEALHDYLASKLSAFKGSCIVETSQSVMDREGRRVCGEYTLTEEDVLSAKKFHDGVVKNSWPIEIWDKDKGTIYNYLKAGEYYEIPFRCLKVKGISNLLCAGRCISVTREALGSTRVMGACISLGEQAGLAAAFYIKNGGYPFR